MLVADIKGWLNGCMRRNIRLTFVLTMGLLIACSASKPKPSQEAQKRVVSLDPSVTSVIKALGRDAWLVGVTKHCDIRGVSIVGDMRPRIARIVSERPDLVVSGTYGFNASDLAALRAANLPLLTFPATQLADFRRAVLLLGDALDAKAPAKALVTRLDDALARARKRQPKQAPRILLVYGADAGYVYTSGGGDHVTELVEVVGAKNAARGGPVTKRVSLSQAVALAPEIILHVAPDARFPTETKAKAFWRHLKSIPAVRHDRVYLWPDNSLARRGAALPKTVSNLSMLVGGVE